MHNNTQLKCTWNLLSNYYIFSLSPGRRSDSAGDSASDPVYRARTCATRAVESSVRRGLPHRGA